jgi:hypothetical protein
MELKIRPPGAGGEKTPVIPHLFSLTALKSWAIFFLEARETGRSEGCFGVAGK